MNCVFIWPNNNEWVGCGFTTIICGFTDNKGVVYQWVHLFKSRRTKSHDEERSSKPSVVSNELYQKIYEKVHENQQFTISELSEQCSQIY